MAPFPSAGWSRQLAQFLVAGSPQAYIITLVPGCVVAVALWGRYGLGAALLCLPAITMLGWLALPRFIATFGDAEVKYLLGMRIYHGAGFAADPIEAADWLKEAADAGHVLAEVQFARILATGEAGPQNQPAGLTRLRKLAEGGNSSAMFYLAYLLMDGEEGSRDHEEALRWYVKAADAGEANAMGNLGYLHAMGEVVPQDFEVARGYWLRAAALGSGSAAENLGELYARGCGVAQDALTAMMWYKVALARGERFDEQTVPHYDRVLASLDETSVRRAEALAKAWLEDAGQSVAEPNGG